MNKKRKKEVKKLTNYNKNMQNEPNLLETQMNVTSVKTKHYENKLIFGHRQNEPKTNPIYAESNPILATIAFLPSITLAKEGAKVDQPRRLWPYFKLLLLQVVTGKLLS